MSTKQQQQQQPTSKHFKGTAFPVAVCDAIRHHVAEGAVLQVERGEAFNRRDEAIERKKGLKDRDSKEYMAACRDHSEAEDDIKSLDMSIKFHQDEIKRVVKRADDAQLELKLEPPQPEIDQLPLNADDPTAGGKKRKPRDEPAIDPAKPVGRVKKEVDPLERPLGDLDLRQDLRSKLAETTFKTVRELARAFDGGKNVDWQEILNVCQSDVVAIKRAVQAMREEKA